MTATVSVQKLLAALERINRWVGSAISWFTLFMMLVTVAIVLLRYVFHSGNLIFLNETVIYLHAATFMLGAGYTLSKQGHVRVDVFYRRFSPRNKAWVDAVGTILFLFPLAFFLLFSSLDFVAQSWAIRESSSEPGGIPALFLLKSLIPAMAILLLIQGVVELGRHAIELTSDHIEMPAETMDSHV